MESVKSIPVKVGDAFIAEYGCAVVRDLHATDVS